MTTKHLAVYDYGTGGVWCIVSAKSAEEVEHAYPMLKVVSNRPDWMKENEYRRIEERMSFDLANPTGWLEKLKQQH